MSKVHQICQVLGRKRIADSLGVGGTAVSNAVVAGVFPSSWFAVIADLCVAEGIDCPRDAFNWKAASLQAASVVAGVQRSGDAGNPPPDTQEDAA